MPKKCRRNRKLQPKNNVVALSALLSVAQRDHQSVHYLIPEQNQIPPIPTDREGEDIFSVVVRKDYLAHEGIGDGAVAYVQSTTDVRDGDLVAVETLRHGLVVLYLFRDWDGWLELTSNCPGGVTIHVHSSRAHILGLVISTRSDRAFRPQVRHHSDSAHVLQYRPAAQCCAALN